MAALCGKSIKDYVLERTLGANKTEDADLRDLEKLLDSRIRAAKGGAISRRSPGEVFHEVTGKQRAK
jgi:hypothetical protein